MSFNRSRSFTFVLSALLLLSALLFVAAAPASDAEAGSEPQMIKVTVAVFDYTAGSAKLEAASANGTIFAATEVQLPAGSMAIDAIEAALQAKKVSYTAPAGDFGKYLTEVNGLKEMDGGKESGWLFCLNNDFGNSGVAATEIQDGDELELHYSMLGYGTDVGNYWDALPILSSFTLAGKTLSLSSETVYDADWNAQTLYYVGEGENRQLLAGDGSAANPFQLNIYVADDLELQKLSAEYSTSLHPEYRQLLPDPGEAQDYSKPLEFTLSTRGGILQSHYRVSLMKESAPKFSDVPENHWACSYIYELSQRGVVKGDGKGGFGAQEPIKRCDFITMLARLSGESLPESSPAFSDVPADAYYAPAVSWALQAGITGGRTESSFAPTEYITREEIATMLHRYSKYKKLSAEQLDVDSLSHYADAESCSSFAREGMEWSLDTGLLGGYPDGTLQPQEAATRAAVAKMLARLLLFTEA